MRSRKPRILLVDDEPNIVRFIERNLRVAGYHVLVAGDARGALQRASDDAPDLVILDLMLPDLSGFEVCRQLRAMTEVPIIVLSAKGDLRDKVVALDLGADDYLTKPFGVEELLARLRAALRRARGLVPASIGALVVGQIEIDFASRRVRFSGREIKLTRTEFDLLALLARYSGKVLSHRAILAAVWGPEYADDLEYLRVYVARLRRKLEPDSDQPHHLLTEPGVGYVLRP